MVIGQALELWDEKEVIMILQAILDEDYFEIILNKDRELSNEEERKFLEIIEERKEGVPLQYLLGSWFFYDFEVEVERGVLIPRPETELLLEEAIESLDRGARVLEIGTGSGVLAIGLAKHLDADVTAVDISEKAINLAKRNAKKNGVQIDFFISDVYENVTGKYDLIISNPPYIREDARDSLAKELSFEDDRALFGGVDGLDITRRIISGAKDYLNPSGLVLLEIGYDQGDELKKLFKENGFKDILIIEDYNSYDRIGKGYMC